MSKVYVGQTLLRLILSTELDLNDSTALEIKYKKSNGTTGLFTATSDDKPNGDIYYDFQAGDVDVDGVWRFWAYVTFSTGSAPGEAVEIRFYNEGE